MEKLHTLFSHTYRLLSLLLLPPKYYDKKELLILAEKIRDLIKDENVPGAVCSGLEKYIEDLTRLVQKLYNDEDLWSKFKVNLTSTTISSATHVPCPPYESIYRFPTEPKRRMISMPATISEINDFYRKLGLQVKDMQPITGDHISVEVEFLAAIHDARKYSNDQEILELHSKFVEHVISWIPDFVECITKHGDENLNLIAHSLWKVIECDRKLAILTS